MACQAQPVHGLGMRMASMAGMDATTVGSSRVRLATRQPGFAIAADGGLRLPPVVFGISALGNLYREHPPEAKAAIVAACRSSTDGAPLFDGAGKYGAGLALEELGRALRAQGVAAGDVAISDKLGWRRVPLRGPEPTFEPGAWAGLRHDAVLDISHDGIWRCWEEGRALLGEPYRASLLSVHDPDEHLASAGGNAALRAERLRDILGAYRALEGLRARGDALAIGIGAKDWRVAREISMRVRLDWVMLACSLTVLTHPPELLAWVDSLARRGVAVIDSALFHGGFLTGGDRFDYRALAPTDPATSRLLRWRERFTDTCLRHGVTPAHACVAFARLVPGVASVALSTSDPLRVPELVRHATEAPPAALWRELADAGLIDRRLGFLP